MSTPYETAVGWISESGDREELEVALTSINASVASGGWTLPELKDCFDRIAIAARDFGGVV